MLHQTIKRNFSNAFPEKYRITNYKNRLPWVTSEINVLIKEKNKLYRLTLIHSTQLNINKYRNYKRFLNNKLNHVKRDYYNKKMLDVTCEPKKYWPYIRKLINKNDSTQYPDHFLIDKAPIMDSKIIANSFNNFFYQHWPSFVKQN